MSDEARLEHLMRTRLATGAMPIGGGSPDAGTATDAGTTGAAGAGTGDGTETTDDLGDAGKKAIETERATRKAAEKAARDAQKTLEAVQKELDAIKAGSQSEHEKAIEKARAEADAKARSEVLSIANQRLLAAEIKSAAAGKLADPADAIRLLDLDEFKVADDGTVDSKAISKAIDELVKEKPYLTSAAVKRGSGDGGARGNGDAKPDMNSFIRKQAGRST